MKCIVLKTFRDKDTEKLHKIGTTYTCSGERFREIQEKGNFLQDEKKPVKTDK